MILSIVSPNSFIYLNTFKVSDIVSSKRLNMFGLNDQREKERHTSNDHLRTVQPKFYRHYQTPPTVSSEVCQKNINFHS